VTAQAPLATPEPADEVPDEVGVLVPLAGQRRPDPGGSPSAGYRAAGNLALKSAELARSPRTPRTPRTPGAEPSSGAARSAVIVARALLEVLSGWRPASQLSRCTSYTLQQDLERRAPRRPTGNRQQLLRVRVSEPTADVAEVCAITHDLARKRVRVMALRMEHREGRWVVTRLQAG
jgi:hypothetical protein